MCTTSKKTVFLFCIFNLITPFLYAQSDAVPLPIMPFPEKEQLNNAIIFNILPILEPPPLKDIEASALPPSEKEAIKNVTSAKTPFPAYLIPARQTIAFMRAYGTFDEVFLDFIDKRIYEDSIQKNEEKRLIREQWAQYFGLDIWYPYFKAKEIEDWISDSTKVEVFHFKGRMKFENNQIRYTFKMQF